MDYIIKFFRDVLSGPVYIVVAIISGILICSCIGYLAEQHLNKKNKMNENLMQSDKTNNKFAGSSNTNKQNVVVNTDLISKPSNTEIVNQSIPEITPGVKK